MVFCNKIYREWLPYKVLLTLGKLFNQAFSTEFFFLHYYVYSTVWCLDTSRTTAQNHQVSFTNPWQIPLPWQLLSCYKFHNAIRTLMLCASLFPSLDPAHPLCQFLKESCTYWHQTDKLLVDQAGQEFLGSNHKHLASTEGAANPSAVTDPQLCLLPIAAWQRLWVAFRKT